MPAPAIPAAAVDDIESFGLDLYSPDFLTALEKAEQEFPSSFCAPPPPSASLPDAESESDSEDEFDALLEAEPCTQAMHDALDDAELSFTQLKYQVNTSVVPLVDEEMPKAVKAERLCVKVESSDSEVEVVAVNIKPKPKPKRACLKRKRGRRGCSDADSDFSDDLDLYKPSPERKPFLPSLTRSSPSPCRASSPSPRAPSPTIVHPHLSQFFASYKFKYDPDAPVSQQFYALRDAHRFRWGIAENDNARHGYCMALCQAFELQYGNDATSLPSWRMLCEAVGILPVPTTVWACSRAIDDAHVNIIDLLDTKNTGDAVPVFATEEELSDYTHETKKFFPRNIAIANALLKRFKDIDCSRFISRGPDCNSPFCRRIGTQRCAACKQAFYCSVACQKIDWKLHKQDCRTNAAPAATVAWSALILWATASTAGRFWTCYCENSNFGKPYCKMEPRWYHASSKPVWKAYHSDRHPAKESCYDKYAEEPREEEPRECGNCRQVERCFKAKFL
ncbi:hypothetical protein MKEN_00484500 [Mycena kentingensis (nom. inval.)]|nr:hypothetical protein MKEN_00484500 [Mycena kentingensis (nom. inval.)]